MNCVSKLNAGISASALAMACSPAYAQADAPQADVQSQEIVVTAQRRAESVQDTPLAISALGGDALRNSGVTNVLQLNNSLPNVNINQTSGTVRITVRGIGIVGTQPNQEGAVAFHVDGVYVGRPEAQSDGFFDVERVEVVRGPQGTLYGRNATGGAINVITRNPTSTLTANAELSVGNYDLVSVEAGIGGPITDALSFRVAGQAISRSGWGHDGFGRDINDQKTRAIRGKLKFEPTSNLSVLLAADYFHEDDASGLYNVVGPGDLAGRRPIGVELGFPLARNPARNTNGDFPAALRKNDWSVTSTVQWDISDLLAITSITGYRSTEFHQQADADSTAISITRFFNDTRDKQFSQELRAAGSIGNLKYLLGGYLFRDDFWFDSQTTRNPIQAGGPFLLAQGLRTIAHQKTDAEAVFGQISYDFNSVIGIDLGGRYSWEVKHLRDERTTGINLTMPFNRDVPAPFIAVRGPIKASFSKFTPKATLRIKPNNDILFYATYSTGFRSGGFALGSLTPAFLPENVKDYEAGLKIDWLGGAVQTNLSGFYYDYSDLQTTKTNPAGGAALVESAGKARIKGLEGSIVVKPVQDFRVNADFGVLNARYRTYASIDPYRPLPGGVPRDLKGFTLPQAPDFTVNAGAQYTFHPQFGELTLRGEMQAVSRTYFTAFNTKAFSQPSYQKFDAYLNFRSNDGHWTGSLFVRNLTDKTTYASIAAAPISVGGPVVVVAAEPRSYGLRAGYRF